MNDRSRSISTFSSDRRRLVNEATGHPNDEITAGSNGSGRVLRLLEFTTEKPPLTFLCREAAVRSSVHTTRSRLSVSQEAVTEGSAKAVVQLP
jgi:hypothetical protein